MSWSEFHFYLSAELKSGLRFITWSFTYSSGWKENVLTQRNCCWKRKTRSKMWVNSGGSVYERRRLLLPWTLLQGAACCHPGLRQSSAGQAPFHLPNRAILLDFQMCVCDIEELRPRATEFSVHWNVLIIQNMNHIPLSHLFFFTF